MLFVFVLSCSLTSTLHRKVINRLEQVVDSFLSQILEALGHHSASEALGSKISFELVDRRKPPKTDGLASGALSS
jgi:hypothetical protein